MRAFRRLRLLPRPALLTAPGVIGCKRRISSWNANRSSVRNGRSASTSWLIAGCRSSPRPRPQQRAREATNRRSRPGRGQLRPQPSPAQPTAQPSPPAHSGRTHAACDANAHSHGPIPAALAGTSRANHLLALHHHAQLPTHLSQLSPHVLLREAPSQQSAAPHHR